MISKFCSEDAQPSFIPYLGLLCSIIVDQWTSLAATACGTGCYQGAIQFLSANSLYDVKLEYKDPRAYNNLQSFVSLAYNFPTGTLPNCVANVGSAACSSCTGTTCTYSGNSVLIPSARLFQSHPLNFKIYVPGGLTATYYDNLPSSAVSVDGGIDRIDVIGTGYNYGPNLCTATCLVAGCPGSGMTCTCTVVSGSVTAVTVNTPGSGYLSLNPPKITCDNGTGTGQSFIPRIVRAYGVVGGANLPDLAVVEPTVDWSGPTTTDRPYPNSIVDGQFAVRWSGFVLPSRQDEYTFYVTLAGGAATSERVRLWVDDALLIDQWGSLAAALGEPSGTIGFPLANDYYNIQLDYKIVSIAQASRGFTLKVSRFAMCIPRETECFESARQADNQTGR